MSDLIERIRADREAGTPGPWVMGGALDHTSAFDHYDPFGPDGCSVACVSGETEGNADPIDVINARRIARVPEMESRILADAEALKAADALIDHAQAAHDELALWFECASELERHGFEIGDTEAAMNALDRAITAYRKARGSE